MFKLRRRNKNFSPARVADRAPKALAHGADALAHGADALAHGAEGAASRLAEAADVAAKKTRTKLSPSGDELLRAQLMKTSRELARESSDLGSAVDSLSGIIRANRKAAAKGRTRLIGGLAIGAGLMYHLDADHGRERRAATVRRLGATARRAGISAGDH